MSDEATREAVLKDPARLEALRRTGLLDTPPEEEFDRLTRLVCRLLGVPAALVSLVEGDRQFFKSAIGLPEPWLLRRETSLLHSFCQHVVAAGVPLIIQDAATHPLVSNSLAVPELGVLAYLGMPLTTPDGHVLGALCAIDTEARSWTPGDAAGLRDLAVMTISEVTLRTLARELSLRVEGETAAREAAQARAQRLEALRRLARGAAHEFASVMQSVQSGVRLAAARIGQDPAAAQSILTLVSDVARRGGVLAERLRIFVAVSERRVGPVDVAALLRRLEGAQAGASDIPVPMRVNLVPGKELPRALADPEELMAVLTDLVATARGAMPEGGTLVLEADLDEVGEGAAHPAQLRPGRYVRLSMGDTGTGKGGEQARAGSPSPSGSGQPAAMGKLGLDFALDFAAQIGGGLTWESRPGAGITVALWLPLAKAGLSGAPDSPAD